jgi:sugar lactone lactonase YvrE
MVLNSGERWPLRTGGDAGTPQNPAQANLLRTADRIVFDAHGNLYITVNTNRLVRLAPDGALTELARIAIARCAAPTPLLSRLSLPPFPSFLVLPRCTARAA